LLGNEYLQPDGELCDGSDSYVLVQHAYGFDADIFTDRGDVRRGAVSSD
jgi:hypothetical protein